MLKVFRRVRDEIKKVFEAYAAGRRAGYVKQQPAFGRQNLLDL